MEDYKVENGVLYVLNKNIETINIPDGVTKLIPMSGLWDNYMLKSVTIPASVEEIEEGVFLWNDNLKKITVDNGNKRYVSKGGCLIDTKYKKLIVACKKFNIPKDITVETIGEAAFVHCDTDKILLPHGVREICGQAFGKKLVCLEIPSSVCAISEYAFKLSDNLYEIKVDSQNTVYAVKNKCLIDMANKCVVRGCKDSVIPSDGSVVKLGASAFFGCKGLTQLFIPPTVTEIHEDAFHSCYNLTLEVSDEQHFTYSTISKITERKYTVVSEINSVIENGVLKSCSLKRGSWYNAHALRLFIPNAITKIGEGVFKGNEGLESVIMGKDVVEIVCNAFSNCPNLMDLRVVPENPELHSAGDCVIRTEQKRLILGCMASEIPSDGSVKQIWSAFYDCKRLRRITIPEGVTYLGAEAFHGCEWLKEAYLPKSLEKIGENAFYGCATPSAWGGFEPPVEIYYSGTAAEWFKIDGAASVDAYKIHCTDETIEN